MTQEERHKIWRKGKEQFNYCSEVIRYSFPTEQKFDLDKQDHFVLLCIYDKETKSFEMCICPDKLDTSGGFDYTPITEEAVSQLQENFCGDQILASLIVEKVRL